MDPMSKVRELSDTSSRNAPPRKEKAGPMASRSSHFGPATQGYSTIPRRGANDYFEGGFLGTVSSGEAAKLGQDGA